MPDEVWKAIPGHRGYQASSLGRVRSVPRTLRDGRTAGGVVLTPTPDRDGYLRVQLGRRKVGVHVAVQLAFAGPPEVRHLDGDHENNRPENLAWGSRVENEQDKRKGRGREEGKEEGRKYGMDGECSRPSVIGTSTITAVTNAD